jgi:hypothetical protein
MKTNVILVWSALLIAGSGMASDAFAQSALERLERQIRQRVGADEGRESDAAGPTLASPTPTPRAGKNAPAGYLGVLADDQKDRGRGVRILDVRRGSPAEKAGLRRQDLITAVAGIRVRQMSDFNDILTASEPGRTLDFEVLRDGGRQKLRVALEQRPAAAERSSPPPETVPPPAGEPLPPPPPPGEPPSPPSEPPSLNEQLQRRIAKLEHRVAELERQLAELKKKRQTP